MSEARRGVRQWNTRFGKPVLFATLVVAGAGAYLATTVPVSVFPDTNFPRILIGIENGVMPIGQMDATVTRPVEEALNTVPGLLNVRSTTSRGSAEINLFFDWRTDMFRALDLVNAALARVQGSLPATARLSANRLTFAAFPILGYSLTSDTVSQTELWALATYQIRPRLNRLPGVSTVLVQGGSEPEFDIEPDPARLLQTQVTVPEILDALSRGNILDSPGLIEDRHQLVLTLVSGQATAAQQIAAQVIKTTPESIPIRIADIGTVAQSVRPVYTTVTANGRRAVLLNVFRQPEGNTVAVARETADEMQDIQRSLPAGIRVASFYDQSEVVEGSIRGVRDAILIGLVLAACVVILFLRDWGSSIVAGLVVPATIAITCAVLRLLGQSFNLMTLGGLAAAVGLVIDDAIVVVENIVRHRQSGQTGGGAIGAALREVRIPLVGSTITPIVVFLPLAFITGVTGVFFRALALTVAIALLTSLALALGWTPTLSYYLLRKASPEKLAEQGRSLVFYERGLGLILSRPWILALAAAALIAISFLSYRRIGSDLLPEMDEGGFVLDYIAPAGSSLDDTNRMVSGVENLLTHVPEVESTSRRTGLQLGLAAVTEANTGDISVKLKAIRRRSVQDVIADVRSQVNDRYPTLDTEFIQVLQDLIGDLTSSPEPIEVKLFSSDASVLTEWAPRVADAIKPIPGVVDLKNGIEDTISGPALTFAVEPATAARAGFTVQEIEVDASAILFGEPASTPVILNDRPYTLRVRFPQRYRASVEAMQNTLLVSATGRAATLGTLAHLQESPGQTEVRRENLQRNVAVTARLEGRSLGAGMAAVRKAVSSLSIPAAVRIEYGGTYAEQKKSFRDLSVVLLLAVILIFIVLLFEFQSFAAPVAITASALLSTGGVFLALLLTGTTFNLSSFMGLIMVVGIVAKNGILLLDADQRFRNEGLDAQQAMIQAGERRLRPILMTALATAAGMIPLAMALGAGSQMLQPLAIAVIGGLAASLLISLIVTPTVHYFLAR